jgi:DnaJ-class molecular chaperone
MEETITQEESTEIVEEESKNEEEIQPVEDEITKPSGSVCTDCAGTGLKDFAMGQQAQTLCTACNGSGKIE